MRPALASLAARLGEPEPQSAASELRALAHILSGGAGTFGLERLGTLAEAVERRAFDLIDAPGGEVSELVASCHRLIGEIAALEAGHGAGTAT